MKVFPPYLDKGSRGTAVLALQCFLVGLGRFNEKVRVDGLIIDGDYGDLTATAVRSLQALFNFDVKDQDGNFGPLTRPEVAANFGFDADAIDVSPEMAGTTFFFAPDQEGEQVWPEAA